MARSKICFPKPRCSFKIVNNYYTILSLWWCTGNCLSVNKIEKCIMHSLTVYIILLFPNLSIKTTQLKSICKIVWIPIKSIVFSLSKANMTTCHGNLLKMRNNIPIRIKGQYKNVLYFLKRRYGGLIKILTKQKPKQKSRTEP